MTEQSSWSLLERLLTSNEPLLRRTATDEEYSALVDRLTKVDPTRMHREVIFFLIFVGLFMRREVFRKGRGLWNDIWARLGQPGPAQTPTLYDAMERTLNQYGITVIRAHDRRFVETFWREVGITPANLEDLLDLFRWYYGRHYPDRGFDETLFDQWVLAAEFSEQKPLMVEAVEKLVFIMEAMQEPDCPSEDGEAGGVRMREYLRERLGFDPHRVLPSDRAVHDFYLESLRLISPAKMRRLAQSAAVQRITMPDGQVLWGHEVASRSNLPLGEYTLAGRTYQVTPHPKASLEVLAGWRLGSLLYPFRGYVAYRSGVDFPVMVDGDERRPSRLFRRRQPAGYVWLSRIPVGREMSVDGNEVRPAEGVEWQPTLRLWRPSGDKPPRLYVDVSSLRINYEELQGRQITVTSGEQSAHGRLNADGSVWMRDVSFDLSGCEATADLAVLCGEDALARRTVTLADAMLFADATGTAVSQRRSVAPGSWFYLFSTVDLADDDVHGGTVRQRWEWGRFHVAHIRRTEGTFTIEGERDWQLFEEEFLHLSLHRPDGFEDEADDDIVHDLESWAVNGRTNLAEQRVTAAAELLAGGKVIFRTGLITLALKSAYGTVRGFRLDRQVLPARLAPGEYLFRLTAAGLTAFLRFRLVPRLRRIHGADLMFCEGTPVLLTAEWESGQRYDLPVVQAAVEPAGPRGTVRFSPRTLRRTVRLNDAGVTAVPMAYTVECRPWVFGVRMLQSAVGPDGRRVQSVLRTVTREDLLRGAQLYCFGRPGAGVVLMLPAGAEHHMRFDDEGNVEVPARWLVEHLTSYRTCFPVRSEDIETRFDVVWRPTVSALTAERRGGGISFRVAGTIPPGVSMVVYLTDLYGRTKSQQVLHGAGAGEQVWEGEFPWAPKCLVYVRLGFLERADGEVIPLSREMRIEGLTRPRGTGAGLSTTAVPTVYAFRTRK